MTKTSTIPSQCDVAPDHYRVPGFSDDFRFGSWPKFTLARSRLYKTGDVVWTIRDGSLLKAIIDRVTYKEFHGAYRWIEVYHVRRAVLYDDRWANQTRHIMPSDIRDGYELHAARLASKIATGQEYGSIGI